MHLCDYWNGYAFVRMLLHMMPILPFISLLKDVLIFKLKLDGIQPQHLRMNIFNLIKISVGEIVFDVRSENDMGEKDELEYPNSIVVSNRILLLKSFSE